MICTREEMVLLDLDYGDLIRPPFQILPSRGWGQCTNKTSELLIVYGPKHPDERSIFDTSPYILQPEKTTPDGWDCDGFLLPAGRQLRCGRSRRSGPLAIKFWNFRRFSVFECGSETYQSSWNNGIFQPSQINWAIPNLTYQEIMGRTNRRT